MEAIGAGGTTESGLARSVVVAATLVVAVVAVAAVDLRLRDVLS